MGDDAFVAKDIAPAAEIARRITSLMEDRGWSARELGRKAGLKNEKHVSVLLRRLKKGEAKAANARTLDAIATVLGVSSADLLSPNWTPGQRAERLAGMLAIQEGKQARFPNLELMVQYTRASGTYRWEDSTIDLLRDGAMGDEDVPPEEWQRAADHLQSQITAAKLSWEQLRFGHTPETVPPKRLGPKRN